MDIPVAFEWDDAKADSNLAKHKIAFATAIAIFANPRAAAIDATRADDDESRRKATRQIRNKLFTMVYVMRGDVCRIISARRANSSEERAYGTHDTRP